MKEVVNEAVKERLLDPQSALFKSYRAYKSADNKIAFCGSVNAKNTLGGYAGTSMYAVELMTYKDNDGGDRYVATGATLSSAIGADNFTKYFPECLL